MCPCAQIKLNIPIASWFCLLTTAANFLENNRCHRTCMDWCTFAKNPRSMVPLTKSCFPFENFLGQMKRLLCKPAHPLVQVVRRLSEKKLYRMNTSKALSLREHNSSDISVREVLLWRICCEKVRGRQLCPVTKPGHCYCTECGRR